MKNLFLPFGLFAFLVLSVVACQKREVDCDNYRSTCTYTQFSYSDCTPNGSEIGWEWDNVDSDTTIFQTWGCPESIEAKFVSQQLETLNSPSTPENVQQFLKAYPSTCNCN